MTSENLLPKPTKISRQGKGGGGIRSTSFKKGDPRCMTKGTFKKGHIPTHKGKTLKENLTQQKLRRMLVYHRKSGIVNFNQIHRKFRELSRKNYENRKILRAMGLSPV